MLSFGPKLFELKMQIHAEQSVFQGDWQNSILDTTKWEQLQLILSPSILNDLMDIKIELKI